MRYSVILDTPTQTHTIAQPQSYRLAKAILHDLSIAHERIRNETVRLANHSLTVESSRGRCIYYLKSA